MHGDLQPKVEVLLRSEKADRSGKGKKEKWGRKIRIARARAREKGQRDQKKLHGLYIWDFNLHLLLCKLDFYLVVILIHFFPSFPYSFLFVSLSSCMWLAVTACHCHIYHAWYKGISSSNWERKYKTRSRELNIKINHFISLSSQITICAF